MKSQVLGKLVEGRLSRTCTDSNIVGMNISRNQQREWMVANAVLSCGAQHRGLKATILRGQRADSSLSIIPQRFPSGSLK